MHLAPDSRLRLIRRAAVGVATLGILTSLTVGPAFAAEEEVEFSITGGTLSLVTKTATSFGNVPFQLSGTAQTTDSDYTYTVSDGIGNLEDGWTVTVAGENLTSTGGGSIPVGSIAITSESLVSTAGEDTNGVTPSAVSALTAVGQPLLTAVDDDGDGTYDHTVNIEVTVPNLTAAGDYTGTITFTATPETP